MNCYYMFILLALASPIALQAMDPNSFENNKESKVQFIVRFSDKPGIYKIKVELVNNVGKKGPYDYSSINSEEIVYTQQEDNVFSEFFVLPQDATSVRISVRKKINGEFKRGGFKFISAKNLRELVDKTKNLKSWDAGILLKDQFENIVNNRLISNVLGTTSIYDQTK